jgi:hypothetical protein
MSKFGRQSDQILRPWTLDANFDQEIARECDELEKSLRRTSPFKQGGDYSYIQQRRFDNTDTDAAGSFNPPSKILAHSDIKPIKNRSTQINNANETVSPRRLPKLAKHSPPSTQETSAARTRKMGEASKREDKHQMETRILNDHRTFYADSLYTSPIYTKAFADTSTTTTFNDTSRVKEIAKNRHETNIEDNLRVNRTMPLTASKEKIVNSKSGIVSKAKSMPNLMEFSSVLDGVQDREKRADMYSTKRTSFLTDTYPSSSAEVNHDFYTRNFNQPQKGKDTLMSCLRCTPYVHEIQNDIVRNLLPIN